MTFPVCDCDVTEESFLDRKNLMEAELVRSKNDMMCLNNQLLEAIQRKLELSQELEAWQVGSLFLCRAFCPSHPVCCILNRPKSSLMLSFCDKLPRNIKLILNP